MIFTDGWKSYEKIGQKFLGHCKVNHSKEFVNYKECVILPERDIAENVFIGTKKYDCHI